MYKTHTLTVKPYSFVRTNCQSTRQRQCNSLQFGITDCLSIPEPAVGSECRSSSGSRSSLLESPHATFVAIDGWRQRSSHMPGPRTSTCFGSGASCIPQRGPGTDFLHLYVTVKHFARQLKTYFFRLDYSAYRLLLFYMCAG